MRERTVLKIGEFARVNQVSIATLRLPTALPGNEQINIGTLPGGLVASTIHTGYDLSLGQAHVALYRWMKDNGYRPTGSPRLLRLRHGELVEPTQYVTEVQFPVAKQANEHHLTEKNEQPALLVCDNQPVVAWNGIDLRTLPQRPGNAGAAADLHAAFTQRIEELTGVEEEDRLDHPGAGDAQ